MGDVIKPHRNEKAIALLERLRGFLQEAPTGSGSTFGDDLIKSLNGAIDEINEATGEDYSKFKVQMTVGEYGTWMNNLTYRTNLSGLIGELASKYHPSSLSKESKPPTTVITNFQTQEQQQTATITLLLEFQSKVDEAIRNYEDGTKEKDFLTKLKESLPAVRNYLDLLHLVFDIANSVGLTPDKIPQILK